jgi:two-component system cell cycle sensor histidine kinase/response regulator CckA
MAIRSLLWFPFAYRDDGLHLLVFNQVSRPRQWTDAELELVADTSEHIAVVLRQHQAAAAPQAADERLRLAQKMEAVSLLAGGVAHDVNNLLGVIQSYTSLAQVGLRADASATRDLLQVQRATDRAATLARRLLALSRRDTVEPKPVAVAELFRELERMLPRLLGPAITLAVDVGAAVGSVWVDPGQFEHTLLNLVTNARDARPRGGMLTLRADAVQVGRRESDAPNELPPRAYVRITVQDTGAGIPDDVRARIFEPFFTTKSADKGTGLGLALVYTFVRQSGGAVTVASPPGDGATFTLWLPRYADVPR